MIIDFITTNKLLTCFNKTLSPHGFKVHYYSKIEIIENLLKTLTVEEQDTFRSEPLEYFLDFGLSLFQG